MYVQHNRGKICSEHYNEVVIIKATSCTKYCSFIGHIIASMRIISSMIIKGVSKVNRLLLDQVLSKPLVQIPSVY